MDRLNPDSQATFGNVYILGGSPCSGKSTLAQMISDRHNLAYYKVDDHQEDHLQRAKPTEQPMMCWYRRRDWNAIWSQPVNKLENDLLAFDKERFNFILDDLARYPRVRPLLVEGAALEPELWDGLPIVKSNVIYLVPTPEFQLAHYQQRSWIQPILDACSKPEEAFEHWMRRDELFGATVLSQANERGYSAIQVDGLLSIDDLYRRICEQFGLNPI